MHSLFSRSTWSTSFGCECLPESTTSRLVEKDGALPSLLSPTSLTLPLKKNVRSTDEDSDGDNSTNPSPNAADTPDSSKAPSVRSSAASESVYYTPKDVSIPEETVVCAPPHRGEAPQGDAAQLGVQEHIPTFQEHYELTPKILGSGAAGDVREAICRRTGAKVAVKTYAKDSLSVKALANMRSEIDVHIGLSHAAVVKVEAVYETDKHLQVVMEQLQGGELFDRILEVGRFSELKAAKTCLQILRVLSHLHGKRIVHRDIKPENLMYAHAKGESVKLIDFGFAVKRSSDEPLTQKCGTMQYVAPEVLKGEPYDCKVDVWSLGNVTYIMLTGRPLYAGDEKEILRQKKADQMSFSKHFKWCVSDAAQDLVKRMLELDPSKRISAVEAMSHPWFRRTIPSEQAAALAEARDFCPTDESEEDAKPATRVFKVSGQSRREFDTKDLPPNPVSAWWFSLMRDLGVSTE